MQAPEQVLKNLNIDPNPPFDFPCLSKDVAASALTAGLMRDIDMPLSTKVKAVYLDFAQFGVPAVGEDRYFTPDSELDGENCRILGIEVLDSTSGTNILSQTVLDNLAATLLNQGMFVASNTHREQICSVPLATMNRRLNNGKTCQFLLTDHVWSNCYVSFITTGSLSTTNGLWFNVYYNSYGQ